MAKNKVSPSELDDEVYYFGANVVKRILIGSILLFFIGLLTAFPVRDNIVLAVTNVIQNNRTCPVSFEKVEVSFLLPSVVIRDTTVEGTCFNNPYTRLPLGDVKIYFYGPSFSPLGLKFKTEIDKGKTDLDVYLSAGITSHSIRINESTIDASVINKLAGEKFQFNGTFEVDSVINLVNGKANNGNVFIRSSSFSIPPQTIMSFNVPNMPIRNVVLKAIINAPAGKVQEVEITNFEVGSNDAPVLGQIKGPIKLNSNYIQGSEVSLNGKIKFSKSFLDNFAILNLLIGGKSTDPDGFYKMNIGGSLGAPKPSFQ